MKLKEKVAALTNPKAGDDNSPKSGKADPPVQAHPRKYLDEELAKNYPGHNLEQLDSWNKPVIPGVPDTHEMSVLRRTHKPSIQGGPKIAENRQATPKKKLNQQINTLLAGSSEN